MTWNEWISDNLLFLRSGERLDVPATLPNPSESGFSPIPIAEYHGQVSDLAMPLEDGSRIHLWIMPNGSLIAHMDRFNPANGPIAAIRHIATETKYSGIIKISAFLFLISRLSKKN